MKILIVATCLIFAMLFALLLYTHYDTQKFIQSLPQAPTTQREVSPGEKTPMSLETGTPENEAEQPLVETDAIPDNHGDFHDHTHYHGPEHPDNSLVGPTSFLEVDVMQHAEESVEDIISEKQLPPGLVLWKSVDSEGVIRVDREAVIAEFGNTPKVYKYLELANIINTADSYTAREYYEYLVLEKEFTQDPNILPSHIEKVRQAAARNPDAVTRSWRSLKNDPNITIRIIR